MQLARIGFWTAIGALGIHLFTGSAAMAAGAIRNGEFNNSVSSNDFNFWKESGTVGTFSNNNGNNWATLGWASGTLGAISQTFSLAAGAYKFSFDYLLQRSEDASLSVLLKNVTTGAITAFSWDGNAASRTADSFLEQLQLTGGSYKLTFSGSLARVDSVGLTAVPGPIAAAGLPALLALGGFAAFRRRQRAV